MTSPLLNTSYRQPAFLMTYFTCLIRSIEFDEFLEFVIARQGDGRDVHNEILQVYIIIFFLETKEFKWRRWISLDD